MVTYAIVGALIAAIFVLTKGDAQPATSNSSVNTDFVDDDDDDF